MSDESRDAGGGIDWVERVASGFEAGGARALSLDEIGEAIGVQLARPDQIEHLFDRLENGGFSIGSSLGADLSHTLRSVLGAARQLRTSGKTTAVSAIAEATGLSVREVRVALLYAEVISR